MESVLKLRQIGSLEKAKLTYDKEMFQNSGELKLRENTSRTISPVKDYKDESKILDDMDIVERITLMKELKKNESFYQNKGRYSSYRNQPYASSSEQIIISPEFPSPNSSNYIPKSIVSSSTVSNVGRDGSIFGDDTMNNSLYQYFTGDLKKLVKLKESSELLKEGEISSRRKQNTRDEVISELPDEELGVTTPQESPRRLFTQPTLRYKRKSKKAELTLELKNVDSSSYDTEEDRNNGKKLEEKKENEFDFDENNKNIESKPFYKTANDLSISKQTLLHNSISPTKIEHKCDKTKEVDNFQLHQIIFNNSINKDLSKLILNQTCNSRNSVILHEEPIESDQYCIDNLFSQIISLSPEIKVNKPVEVEKKKRSVNFYLKQDDKTSNFQSKPTSTSKLDENKYDSKLNEPNIPLGYLENTAFTKNDIIKPDPIVNSSPIQNLQLKAEDVFKSPEKNKLIDNNIHKTTPSGIDQQALSQQTKKLNILPEDEMFIRFNKRGWICVYCHNFNFEGKHDQN